LYQRGENVATESIVRVATAFNEDDDDKILQCVDKPMRCNTSSNDLYYPLVVVVVVLVVGAYQH
jgi:hypothetical protein